MKKLIYLLLATLVVACNCEEKEQIQNEFSQQASDKFFNNEINESNLELAITYLKTIKHETNYVDSITKLYGYPAWDYYDSFHGENAFEYLIPIVDNNCPIVKSALVINMSDRQTKYAYITRSTYKDKSALLRFDYLTQKVFGTKEDIEFIEQIDENINTSNEMLNGISHIKTKCVKYRAGHEELMGEWTTYCYGELVDVDYDDGDTSSIKRDDDGSGNNDGGGSSTDPTIIETDRFKKAKAKCIKDKLAATTTFNNLLEKYKLPDSEFDLIFDVERIDAAYGGVTFINRPGRQTIINKNGKSEVHVAINDLIENDPLLHYAMVVVHETIHANMFFTYFSKDPNVSTDFKELYKRYKNDHLDGSETPFCDFQHNEMAEEYSWEAADILLEFGQNCGDPYLKNKDIMFYQQYFMNFLRESEIYDDLPYSDKKAIYKAVNDYESKGKKNCN